MKALQSYSSSARIGGVKLFLDDLERIADLFKEKSLELAISDKNYSYESFDEVIDKKGTRPSSLSLSAEETKPIGSISLEVERTSTWIYASGQSVSRSFWYEIKEFLTSKVPWHYTALNPWVWGGGFLLVSSVYNAFSDRAPSGGHAVAWPLWFIRIFLLLWVISVVNRQLAYGVRLVRKHEGGFIKRNSDQILVAVIASIFGSLITLAVQWLMKK